MFRKNLIRILILFLVVIKKLAIYNFLDIGSIACSYLLGFHCPLVSLE